MDKCDCGRVHEDLIRYIVLEDEGVKNIGEIISDGGFRRVLVVTDNNTRGIAERVEFGLCDGEISYFNFDTGDLIPDESSVSLLDKRADNIDLIVAVGSGTINDLARFVSFKKEIEYIIVCTAPSMDGYASSVSPLIIDGLKTTIEAHVPYGIVSDIDVLHNAPKNMICAGFGDLLGKYSCLMDWKASQIFNDEYYCDKVAGLTEKSLVEAVNNIANIANNSKDGIKSLQNSLVLSGVAMSYVGNSRPASGCEHHISHFWEMMFLFDKRPAVLHGIKVGIATLIILRFYEYLKMEKLDWELIRNNVADFDMDNYTDNMNIVFKNASKEIIEEEKRLKRYSKENVIKRINIYEKNWDCFMEEVSFRIPSYDYGVNLLKQINHHIHPKEIGIDKQLFISGVLFAKEIRSRFTLLQLLDDLGLLEKYTNKIASELY